MKKDKDKEDCSQHGCSCCGGEHEKSGIRSQIIVIILSVIAAGIALTLEKFTEVNEYAVIAVYAASFLLAGFKTLIKAAKNIVRGKVFDENLLMSIASVGAFVTRNYIEAAAVMIFAGIGEIFEEAAVERSKRSVKSLMDLRPDSVSVIRGQTVEKVTPEAVQPGDTIIVNPGERVPLDGIVASGESTLDTSSITGESVPREVTAGDEALSGCVNLSGVLTIEVTRPYGQSTVAKIIELVSNSGKNKAKAETIITRFAKVYTPAVVLIAVLIACLPPLLSGAEWGTWIHNGLIVLVVSCPCALVISVPLTYFAGIGGAAKRGVIVKGGQFLDALSTLDCLLFDKTGTLTRGEFTVHTIENEPHISKEKLLSIAAHAEQFSSHPIAKSIVSAHEKEIRRGIVSDVTEHAGHGVSALVDGIKVLVGSHKLLKKHDVPVPDHDETPGSSVLVSENGQYAGRIVVVDEPKEGARETIQQLRGNGVDCVMLLSGDNKASVEHIAKTVGADEAVADLLPEGKAEYLQNLRNERAQANKNGTIAYVGDGINDAPVIREADIGIAMGKGGADAALESADVVIMTDELSKLNDAIVTAKKTRKIAIQNIVFALTIKAAVLVLGALGLAEMWQAVIADVGVSIAAILNAARAGRIR